MRGGGRGGRVGVSEWERERVGEGGSGRVDDLKIWDSIVLNNLQKTLAFYFIIARFSGCCTGLPHH